jgi:hypothetical protein
MPREIARGHNPDAAMCPQRQEASLVARDEVVGSAGLGQRQEEIVA